MLCQDGLRHKTETEDPNEKSVCFFAGAAASASSERCDVGKQQRDHVWGVQRFRMHRVVQALHRYCDGRCDRSAEKWRRFVDFHCVLYRACLSKLLLS